MHLVSNFGVAFVSWEALIMTLLHEFNFMNLIPVETLYDIWTPVIYKHIKCYRQVLCVSLEDLLKSLNLVFSKNFTISKSKGGRTKQCRNLSTIGCKKKKKAPES